MPETFQSVTTAIDVILCQSESEITLDFLKNKVLLEEVRQNIIREENGTPTNPNVAFSTNYSRFKRGGWRGQARRNRGFIHQGRRQQGHSAREGYNHVVFLFLVICVAKKDINELTVLKMKIDRVLQCTLLKSRTNSN